MKFKILFFIMPIIFLISCHHSESVDPNEIQFGPWDYRIIPDKYNTGPKEGTVFNKLNASGYIAPNVYVTLRTDTNPNTYVLSSNGTNQNFMPDKSIVSNYDFSDFNFSSLGANKYPCNKYIIFENCKFKAFRNDAVAPGESRVYFIFNNCSFEGGVSSSYIALNNCKIGGFTSDAMNPLREFYGNNVYVYDLFHEAVSGAVHVDGIQIYGDQRSRNNVVGGKWISKVETGIIHFNNIRFEIPSIHFDDMAKGAGVNACVMFQLEFSDVDNVSFENLYVNGGGKWFPIYLDHGKNNEKSKKGSWSHRNLILKNALVSNNFGQIFYPDFLEDAKVQNVIHHDMIFVSSIWKDSAGKVHIIASNDTKSDKILTVKSDAGIFNFEIPHCPSNWVLGGELNQKVETDEGLTDKSGKSYKTYRWQDMPFDKEYIIPENPKFVVCYQGMQQIRYSSFDLNKHYYSEIKN